MAMVQDSGWASHGGCISRGRDTYCMSVTLLTSHEPMSWSNADAYQNIYLYTSTHHSDRRPKVYARKRGKRQAHIVVRKGIIAWQRCTDTDVDGTVVGHGMRMSACMSMSVCV